MSFSKTAYRTKHVCTYRTQAKDIKICKLVLNNFRCAYLTKYKDKLICSCKYEVLKDIVNYLQNLTLEVDVFYRM
jgi:hypothetical protein